MASVTERISQILCISSREDIVRAFRAFSIRQKMIATFLTLAGLYGFFGIIGIVNAKYSVKIPAPGGSITEGIVGVPRFINPLLAVSDADRDLTALVYSGLMRQSDSGELIPDLAESYEVSDDGLSYSFTLRPGLTWHDGTPLTTDDIDFTIKKVQDASIRSPRLAAWQRVSIEQTDATHIVFHLKQPFPQFLENTTLGILPKHLWNNVRSEVFQFSELNSDPIGSGPYKVSSWSADSAGTPTSYTLTPFKQFALGAPYINSIKFNFYPNEDALVSAYKKGAIEAISAISPENAQTLDTQNTTLERATLPRIFAVFLNQNQNRALLQKPIREALDLSIDRKALVDTILKGYATVADGPIPSGSLGYTPRATTTITGTERAIEILASNGWVRNAETGLLEHIDKPAVPEKTTKKNGKTVVKTAAVPAVVSTLSLSLATVDKPELVTVAEYIADTWRKLGVQVTLEKYELGDLNQNIIRPRKFDALFFGEVVGRDPDLYSFWDSGQRVDPGFNIAQYANVKVDKYLGDARTTADQNKRIALLTQAQNEIRNDTPAVFLYSPQFLYIVPARVTKPALVSVITSSERFASIYSWYIDTDNIWKIFVK